MYLLQITMDDANVVNNKIVICTIKRVLARDIKWMPVRYMKPRFNYFRTDYITLKPTDSGYKSKIKCSDYFMLTASGRWYTYSISQSRLYDGAIDKQGNKCSILEYNAAHKISEHERSRSISLILLMNALGELSSDMNSEHLPIDIISHMKSMIRDCIADKDYKYTRVIFVRSS